MRTVLTKARRFGDLALAVVDGEGVTTIFDLGDFGGAVVFGGPVYAFTSEQRARISTLIVTPTHVGVVARRRRW